MKIAIYLRVSTKDQTTALQKDELLAFCQSKGWQDVSIYQDHGCSGTSTTRKGLNQLLNDAKDGKFQVMVAWKLDRVFRSLKHLILTVEELQKRDVSFISLKDNIDFTTSSGRLMFNIIGSFAQFERDIISERVTSGLKAAKKRGAKIGRPSINNNDEISDLRNQGLSIRAIASKLNIGIGSVHRALAA